MSFYAGDDPYNLAVALHVSFGEVKSLNWIFSHHLSYGMRESGGPDVRHAQQI
jgi:hypothetical protein